MAIIGIDLGTTNSLAAVWRNGKSELIPNAAGEFLTPSVVSVDEDGTVLVGQAARERLISHPECTAAGFKRYMGTNRQYNLGGKTFSPEDLSALILRRLKEDAEVYLQEPVEEAVVSVPAYFAEGPRSATKRAGAYAGLKVERLVNEPTAAAVANLMDDQEEKNCLVFDLGGGTLDVSMVERFENVVSVTAVSGNNQLGGRDFDLAIAKGFCDDCGISFKDLTPQQKEILIRQSEMCKMALTTQDPIIMAVDAMDISASLSLSNEWVIRKCSPLFRDMLEPIQKVLMDAGAIVQLDELVMVGGSSRMPTVNRYISKYLHRRPSPDSQPDTAIALGTGICAGMKARTPGLKELVLTDVCPFTLGVARYNPNESGHLLMSPIIERNSVLPISKMEVYYTIRDNQDRVEIQVYQGENPYCRDNTFLGKLELPVPPAPHGEQRVKVRLTYDINSLLEVEVENTEGQMARFVLRNRDISEEAEAEHLERLNSLKLHPREQEENRALVARCERMYAITSGVQRLRIGNLLEWYQGELNSQDPMRIKKANRKMTFELDGFEQFLQSLNTQFDCDPDEDDWEDDDL